LGYKLKAADTLMETFKDNALLLHAVTDEQVRAM
jgi:hypothetical protein